MRSTAISSVLFVACVGTEPAAESASEVISSLSLEQDFGAGGTRGVAIQGNRILAKNRLFTRTDGVWVLESTLPLGVSDPLVQDVELASERAFISFVFVTGGVFARAVRVFKEIGSEWILSTQIDPPPGITFSGAISASEDHLAVQAHPPSTILLYERDGDAWHWAQTLEIPPASVTLHGDGRYLSLSESRLAVGSSGRAYIFVRLDGVWTLEAVLESPSGRATFGGSVALDGSRVLIGDSDPAAGSAHVYARDGDSWTLEANLGGPADLVAIDGERIAVLHDTSACRPSYVFHAYHRSASGTRDGVHEESFSSSEARSVAIGGSAFVIGYGPRGDHMSICLGGESLRVRVYRDGCFLDSDCTAGFCVDAVCTVDEETCATRCDDENICTADACGEAGGCVQSPIAGCCRSSAECSDGNPKTTELCTKNNRCMRLSRPISLLSDRLTE